MTHSSSTGMRRLTAEQVSARVLYVLVALAVLLFGAFFLIGYDAPFEENPSFNAPVLTDAVLIFMYLLLSAAAVVMLVAVVHGIRHRDKSADVVNNIPAAKIAWATAVFMSVCMAVTFALGSDDPVTVNGVVYGDTFWLKATDMFIDTSFVLLAVAACGVAFGLSGYNRKIKFKK